MKDEKALKINEAMPRVAYCGAEGAFAHIAAQKIFPEGIKRAYASFREAYEAVDNGECDYAVLPIENSFAGEVGQVMDMIFEGTLYIRGIYSMPVSQNLLGVPGAAKEDIRRVVSHPQALEQCYHYISRHGYITEQATNTAQAAMQVAQEGNAAVAAIASEETAGLYGLEILERNINESSSNTTKFAVMEKHMSNLFDSVSDKPEVYALMFTIQNDPGSLSRILMTLGIFGYNMRVIRSRPLKGQRWCYYFYTEAEGNKTSIGAAMLAGMERNCEMLKVLGHYTEVEEL